MTAWLLTWLWQGSALAVSVTVALRCVPRLNASTRHLIWCGALAAVAWLGWASSPYLAETALKGCATSAGQISSSGTGLQPCPSGAEPLLYVPSTPDLVITLFVGIWAAIALVGLLRLLPGLRGVYALRDRCTPASSSLESRLPLWLEAKARGRRTQLVICDAVPGATVLGFERPCIAIPSSLVEALTIDELDQVILHEYAHVQRRDDWSRLAQTMLLSVLWIHPAAFVVSRIVNREREMACDEWVVARTGLPKAYARCLARAAEARMQMTRGSTLVPALISGRHELERRVDRLLTARCAARRNVSLGAATAAACAMVLLSVQMQGVRFAEIAEIVLPHVPRPIVLLASGAVRPTPITVRVKADTTGQGPLASTFAPTSQIASADKPDAPNAPNAPSLSARTFTGAYSGAAIAPIAPTAPLAPLAPDRWKLASTAKKTSIGVANVFSRAGVSLARRF